MNRILFTLILLLYCASGSAGQTVAPDPLTFNPTFILPRTAAARPLYGVTYSVVLTRDSLLVDLPYEGRAWSIVNQNPMYQGIRFNSVRFTRKDRERKGIRTITLEPKDGGDIYRLRLSIPKKGEATLDVWSDRRDMVGFTGEIAPPAP